MGAAGIAVRKARGGKRTIALASLATVTGFLALDLLVARAVARSRHLWTFGPACRKGAHG